VRLATISTRGGDSVALADIGVVLLLGLARVEP
jgi:hypothetical protein